MATQTRRPNTTVLNTWTIVPSGTAHGVLSDDSDSTSVFSTSDGLLCGVGLAAPSIPGGALVKSGAIRVRCSKFASAQPSGVVRIAASQPSVSEDVVVSWATPTTITALLLNKAQTDAMIAGSGRAVTHLRVSGGGVVAFETYWDIVYVAKPVTSVTAPSGTLTTNNRPTVTWSNTLDPDGGSQTQWQAKIFTNAVVTGGGFNPETSTSVASDSGSIGNSWRVPEALNDGSLHAYVRVAQTVNESTHWSNWASSAFTVAVPKPNAPSVTRTAENTNGRIRINLATGGGTVTTNYWETQVSNDNATWRSLRTPEGGGKITNTAGSFTAYDWDASNGVQRHIRARAVRDYGSGNTGASAWVGGSATWTSNDTWLKNPVNPAKNVKL